MAELILLLAHIYGKEEGNKVHVHPLLSFRDISELIGIPYDNLTRSFSKLRDEKIISYKGQSLEITDLENLKRKGVKLKMWRMN